MKKVLKTISKLLFGIITGLVLACIEGYIFDLFVEQPKDILGRLTFDGGVAIMRVFVGFYLLLFNIVYCLVYAFVNTKRNRWYLALLYVLLMTTFYLIVL